MDRKEDAILIVVLVKKEAAILLQEFVKVAGHAFAAPLAAKQHIGRQMQS